MILSHIVAMGDNRVIGNKGTLPWNVPEDMKYFMEKTRGHIIIMGRKTFETLEKPLNKRLTIIVTRQTAYDSRGCIVVPTVAAAVAEAKKHLADWPAEVFICGGGEIYKESLGQVDKIYLTHIYKEFPGDAFYPEFDLKKFREVSRVKRSEPLEFSFLVYERV
ncbi:MAG: dihydrofolate reductase [Pseudomonadota bacterium]|nr:dihydrofolate reductase [Pseudomonadota bacterium]